MTDDDALKYLIDVHVAIRFPLRELGTLRKTWPRQIISTYVT
jgi:hypothetical protein